MFADDFLFGAFGDQCSLTNEKVPKNLLTFRLQKGLSMVPFLVKTVLKYAVERTTNIETQTSVIFVL